MSESDGVARPANTADLLLLNPLTESSPD